MRLFFSVKIIRSALLLAFIVFGTVSVAKDTLGSSRTEQVLHWADILAAYDAYVDNPLAKNAASLLKALPKDRIYNEVGDAGTALHHMFSPENYPVLYEEAISGDRIAIEILFRLLNVSDGGYTELLRTDLGWIARSMPRLFLEILTIYKDTKHVQTFGYPVSFVGVGHNVHMKAAIHILEKRMEALSSVKDPKYAEIRDACIRQLKDEIARSYDYLDKMVDKKAP